MIRKLILLLTFIFTIQFILADEFEVKSFKKDPGDLAARKFQRTDVNGEHCALFKVITGQDGLLFDSNLGIVGQVEYKDGEYWVYVSPKEKRIEIMKQGFTKLFYDIEVPVNSFDVFILSLSVTNITLAALPVTFRYTPENASLYIDGEETGKKSTINLSIGEHRVKLQYEGYQTKVETITVDEQHVFFEWQLEKQPCQKLIHWSNRCCSNVMTN